MFAFRGSENPVTRKLIATALAVGLAMTAAGCNVDPIANKPKSVYVVGDSIVASAAWNNDARFAVPAPEGYSVKVDAFMGQTVADHLAGVRKYASQNVPERLVIELGTNDARDGGWTQSDADAYRSLVNSAPDRTCITFVLPAAGPGASASERTQIAAASKAIRQIAAGERRYQVADFADFHAAHPDLIQPDGIHLRTDGANAQAVKDTYRDWLWSFIAKCPGAPA